MSEEDDKKIFDAFMQTRSLSWPELRRALLRHNENLLRLVSGSERWSAEKMARVRAEIGDLGACYLVDDEDRLRVTRNPDQLQLIMRMDQLLTLLELPTTNKKPS